MQATVITRSFLVFLVSLCSITLATTRVVAQTHLATSYSFTVNTTNDTHDAHPGDGICADKHGRCSLRAAIEEADALPSGSSITITVPKGTYRLPLGTLALTANTITITGASNQSTLIQGNHTFTILSISTGVSVYLSQLTIEGGNSFNSNGGGIYNSGTLSLSNSILSSNSAPNQGAGGAIFNNGGKVSVNSSTLSNNYAVYEGGGIENYGASARLTVSNSTLSGNSTSNYGGGINNDQGTLSVIGSTFSKNSARDGGGIDNGQGIVSVSSSTFSKNSAFGGNGGGICNSSGTVSVSSSTFSKNSADYGYGGGIENFGALARLTLTNSTFSDNSVRVGYGGGVDNGYATLSVRNSTFSGNIASNGGSFNNSGGTVELTATIVANSPNGGNCTGSTTDGGYNLDSGTSCGFHLSTDLNNTDPMLGPLGNNGGPTHTMALLQGSPAIDRVNNLNDCPSTDQRGYARPDNGESTCDIGAFESSYAMK